MHAAETMSSPAIASSAKPLQKFSYENFCSGFAELAMAGELIVSAACIGDDTELTGQALRNYPRLPELLQPHRIPTAEESMSADEWKSCHPELVDRRRPPLIAARL